MATNRFVSEQPMNAEYVRAIRAPTTELHPDHVWEMPVPSCQAMPPLPLPDVMVPSDYVGAFHGTCTSCSALPRCIP